MISCIPLKIWEKSSMWKNSQRIKIWQKTTREQWEKILWRMPWKNFTWCHMILEFKRVLKCKGQIQQSSLDNFLHLNRISSFAPQKMTCPIQSLHNWSKRFIKILRFILFYVQRMPSWSIVNQCRSWMSGYNHQTTLVCQIFNSPQKPFKGKYIQGIFFYLVLDPVIIWIWWNPEHKRLPT